MSKRERAQYRKLSRGQKAARSRTLAALRLREGREADEKLIQRRITARQKRRAEEQARKERAKERADRKLSDRRKRVTYQETQLLKAKARVKLIRPYLRGFEAVDGFNLREVRGWSKRQRDRIERNYEKLSPLLLKPHVKVRARTKRQLKALTEFQGFIRVPRGMKAVPVVTPSPEHTTVTVTEDGVVQVQAGRLIQRHFFIPEELEGMPRADSIARRMLKDMPAGNYFIKTGEHEAYNFHMAHDPKRPLKENLLYREVLRFINFYGAERVAKFFRGFRWISSLMDTAAANREALKFRDARRRLDKAREKARKAARTVARRIVRR